MSFTKNFIAFFFIFSSLLVAQENYPNVIGRINSDTIIRWKNSTSANVYIGEFSISTTSNVVSDNSIVLNLEYKNNRKYIQPIQIWVQNVESTTGTILSTQYIEDRIVFAHARSNYVKFSTPITFNNTNPNYIVRLNIAK